ncbi:DUF397 domain-containing protein [Streptomyces sp. NPDC048411]|uniref:DUF397 domain-containing protein n=1 Tax=Streptomyces sp. NPDC048411 TaxID=3157206 RepID=UPI003452BD08
MIRKPSAGDASVLQWAKSSYSDSSNGSECIEVAAASDTVHVRDSKNADGPRFAVPLAAWVEFVTYASRS